VGHPPRTIDPAFPYHAWCRGNNKGLLAWDRVDYASLYDELARTVVRERWCLLAWCFMPNHYHVVLRTSVEGFSAGFHAINQRHARRTNRRHGRTDHLFRHRPRTRRITSDADLVGVLLYVMRNPLEAGLVENAAAWPYSSYRATAGLDPAPSWLALDEIYPYFGSTPAKAAAEFARLVHLGQGQVSNTDLAVTPESAAELRRASVPSAPAIALPG
jgi:REP element-mobilizing transposase RayT